MNIALVAHDGREEEMLEWVDYNRDVLSQHNLFATETIGKLIEEIGNLPIVVYPGKTTLIPIPNLPFAGKVTKLLSDQISAMIVEGKIGMLVFFCDNLITQGHQQDVGTFASLHNIAFATNRTTADMLLTSLLFDNPEYKRIIPDCIKKL